MCCSRAITELERAACSGRWPVSGNPGISDAQIIRPDDSRIFYLPQKPYTVLGSLREQLFYPLRSSTVDKRKLANLLDLLDLSHLLLASHYEKKSVSTTSAAEQKKMLRQAKAGFLTSGPSEDDAVSECDADDILDTSRNWDKVLSLGEKQRLAICRLLYHEPQFAILDECTSAVSVDVEHLLYEECQRRKITYVTICHRPFLRKFHDVSLHLQGRSNNFGYLVRDITEKERNDIVVSSKSKKGSSKESSLENVHATGATADELEQMRTSKYQSALAQSQLATRDFQRGNAPSAIHAQQDYPTHVDDFLKSLKKISSWRKTLDIMWQLFTHGPHMRRMAQYVGIVIVKSFVWELAPTSFAYASKAAVTGSGRDLATGVGMLCTYFLFFRLLEPRSSHMRENISLAFSTHLRERFLKGWIMNPRGDAKFYSLQHFYRGTCDDADARGVKEIEELASELVGLFNALVSPTIELCIKMHRIRQILGGASNSAAFVGFMKRMLRLRGTGTAASEPVVAAPAFPREYAFFLGSTLVCALFAQFVSPNQTNLEIEKQSIRADLVYVHQRLQTNAESIFPI